jgi:hypothetical protein
MSESDSTERRGPPLKRRPRPVNFYDRQDDHDCAFYASIGMSTAFIMGKTGLSQSQVIYRLKKAGLTKENNASRMDFRNGKSPFFGPMLATVRSVADRGLLKFLRAHLE